jgi:hypothetical protein
VGESSSEGAFKISCLRKRRERAFVEEDEEPSADDDPDPEIEALRAIKKGFL